MVGMNWQSCSSLASETSQTLYDFTGDVECVLLFCNICASSRLCFDTSTNLASELLFFAVSFMLNF